MLALTKGEGAAARALYSVANAHIALCADTTSLIEQSIGEVLSNRGEIDSVAARVNIALLVRLSQDLRTASMLAGIGYATQAIAIVAGTFEIAFTIAYVGNDERRAEAWRDHDDPTKPFRSVRSLINTVMQEQGAPAEAPGGHYRLYRQLCMGKHGNPLFTMDQSFQERDGRIVISVGPNSGDSTVRAVQFALEQPAGLGGLAARVFLSCFGGVPVSALAGRLQELDEKWKALHDEAVERWGTEDPFPGRW